MPLIATRFLVQGWRVGDPEAVAEMDVPDHETVVEVPRGLLRFRASGGVMGAVLSDEEFGELFDSAHHSARRLENRDRYDVPAGAHRSGGRTVQ